MELVPLSDTTLRYLALDDPVLKRVFVGAHTSDRVVYIVNTYPAGEPGRH